LREFGLIADRFEPGRVRMKSLHDARVRIVRDAAREGFVPKRRYPLIERDLCPRLLGQHRCGKRAGDAADK
jgi:hypothetical protein